MTGEHDATRRSYDAVAEPYAARFRDELDAKPLDRALLRCLAELARDGGPAGPVADIGCGPGHVTGWLASHGTPAVGIDLSAAMVEAGRRDYPGAEFRQGDFLALPAADGEFVAVVTLYAIIHLTAQELPAAFAELHRVVRPGGSLLVSFHAGSEVRHVTEFLGEQVDVDFRFHEPVLVTELLTAAGFVLEASIERVAYPDEVQTRRAYLLARRQP